MKNQIFGAAVALTLAGTASAEDISLRIGSGHPPGVTYVKEMIEFFQPEFKRRVEAETDHTISYVEGYSGSIVTVFEVLEGVQDGILDIGGWCVCFEPSNLPLHAFPVMLPFGPTDPNKSLEITAEVYSKVPYLTDVFEQEFNQKLASLIVHGSYNLGGNFEWGSLDDLKGRRIAGAGLNLNWLEGAGIVPVTTSLAAAYTDMATGVFDGFVMFPAPWINQKLYEPGSVYTLIGFGAMTWQLITINADTYAELPPEVQVIFDEVSAEYETRSGTVNAEAYDKQIAELRDLITVNEIDPAVRQAWAESLQGWVQASADELEDQGLPAKEVLNLMLDTAEKHGYEWPVRYTVE